MSKQWTEPTNVPVGVIEQNALWRQKVAKELQHNAQLQNLITGTHLEASWLEIQNLKQKASALDNAFPRMCEEIKAVEAEVLNKKPPKKDSGFFEISDFNRWIKEKQSFFARAKKIFVFIHELSPRIEFLTTRVVEGLAEMPEVAEMLNKPAILGFEPA